MLRAKLTRSMPPELKTMCKHDCSMLISDGLANQCVPVFERKGSHAQTMMSANWVRPVTRLTLES